MNIHILYSIIYIEILVFLYIYRNQSKTVCKYNSLNYSSVTLKILNKESVLHRSHIVAPVLKMEDLMRNMFGHQSFSEITWDSYSAPSRFTGTHNVKCMEKFLSCWHITI